MEDLSPAPASPALSDKIPEANADPQDPLRPEIEEEDSAPIADPAADMENREGDEAPALLPTDEEEHANLDNADADERDELAMSDDGSLLSDVDEAQFDNFDPSTIQIEDRPRIVDESNVGLLGVHKRKRGGGEDGAEPKKKKKEGRREKPKSRKKKRGGGDDDDEFEGGVEIDGKRVRKPKVGADGSKPKGVRRAKTPENEDSLTPEERRRRALDRKMDEALRTQHRTSRRGRGIDLERAADDEIEQMRKDMTAAAEADSKARDEGHIATKKLTLLPRVTELLNRNTLTSQILDPEINLLEAVRFFLEPLPQDGSLPAYQIQKDLFSSLARLPMTKDALIASGIGKVVIFYTKSARPEPAIKRAAQKLIGEWSRPILKNRNNDYHSKQYEERTFDPLSVPVRGSQPDKAARAAAARKAALQVPVVGNRARVEGTVGTYTVVPRNNLAGVVGGAGGARKLGASGEDTFRKIKARGVAAASKR